jgi:hypothetical protein
MSWLVVFISYLSPVLLLGIVLALAQHPMSSRATPSPLMIRRRDGADNKGGMRRVLMAGETVTQRRRR